MCVRFFFAFQWQVMQTPRRTTPMRPRRCKRETHARALRCAVATAITDDQHQHFDKHFDKYGCSCHVLPAPAPHLQDKRAAVSYVSLCSIAAIIMTSQRCRSNHPGFNDRRLTPTLRASCPVHATCCRRAGTPLSESVPDAPERGLLASWAKQHYLDNC